MGTGVTDVPHPVTVGIGLVGIHDIRTVVARILHAVSIGIGVHARTEVWSRQDPGLRDHAAGDHRRRLPIVEIVPLSDHRPRDRDEFPAGDPILRVDLDLAVGGHGNVTPFDRGESGVTDIRFGTNDPADLDIPPGGENSDPSCVPIRCREVEIRRDLDISVGGDISGSAISVISSRVTRTPSLCFRDCGQNEVSAALDRQVATITAIACGCLPPVKIESSAEGGVGKGHVTTGEEFDTSPISISRGAYIEGDGPGRGHRERSLRLDRDGTPF